MGLMDKKLFEMLITADYQEDTELVLDLLDELRLNVCEEYVDFLNKKIHYLEKGQNRWRI